MWTRLYAPLSGIAVTAAQRLILLMYDVQKSVCIVHVSPYSVYVSVSSESLLPAATKLGQGNVFTAVCDSVNRGGMRQTPPQEADSPPKKQTPSPRSRPPPPKKQTPPPKEADPPRPQETDPPPGILSMSGRYASYWNAFLFVRRCVENYLLIKLQH